MALKAREYEDRIKSMGFEAATKFVMMELIEEHNVLEKHMFAYAQTMEQMIGLLEKGTAINHHVKEEVDKLSKRMDQDQKVEGMPRPTEDRK